MRESYQEQNFLSFSLLANGSSKIICIFCSCFSAGQLFKAAIWLFAETSSSAKRFLQVIPVTGKLTSTHVNSLVHEELAGSGTAFPCHPQSRTESTEESLEGTSTKQYSTCQSICEILIQIVMQGDTFLAQYAGILYMTLFLMLMGSLQGQMKLNGSASMSLFYDNHIQVKNCGNYGWHSAKVLYLRDH